ncbi:MAG: S8 family serine peptidase [Bacteroidia bacterium]
MKTTIKNKLIAVLGAVMLFTNSIKAQGDSCGNAIPMPHSANSALTNFVQTKGATWFSFTPLTTEIKITLTNTNLGTNHIHDLVLMQGPCAVRYFPIGYDKLINDKTDTTLTIIIHDLTLGIPCFIVTVRERPTCLKCCTAAGCSSPTANFNLLAQSLPPPVKSITHGVLSLNGVPTCMSNQVIIRVNNRYLRMNNVNNTGIQTAPVPTFLDSATTQQMANILFGGNTTPLNYINMKKVYPTLTSADSLSTSRDGQIIRIPNFWETFIVMIPSGLSEFFTARTLNVIDGIRYAEPNYVSTLSSVPNDAHYAADQASLHPTTTYPNANINVEGAWDAQTGQSSVRVGVFDTGIDQTNSDLSGQVIGGYDYVNNVAITIGVNHDGEGHGTSCAGIIGALRNNGIGIAGIAGGDVAAGNTGCKLFDMRIADDSGHFVGLTSEAQAIVDGAKSTSAGGYGLNIMSFSNGSRYESLTFYDAIQFADQSGVTFVASRGNYFASPVPSGCGSSAPNIGDATYPACLPDEMVINVGASGTDGNWKTAGNSSSSNCDNYSSMTGGGIDVIAPGTDALVFTTQTSTNGFTGFDGTSASAPHVSGVAALMLSSVNDLVIEDVESILEMSAIEKNGTSYNGYAGYGLIDATAAMNKIKAPAYKIQHFGVGQNATNPTPIGTRVAYNQVVTLPLPYQTLSPGTYQADIFLVTITLNYSLSSPNDQIIGFWPRYSSTKGWMQAAPVQIDNWCHIVSVTNTQAVLQTYIYDFKYDVYGHTLDKIDPWYPVTIPSAKAALSIYTYDKTLADINELNNSNSLLMAVYPNPANNSSMITVSLTRTQQVSLELYDAQGSLVRTITKGQLTEGKNQYQVSLSDIADGVYFYRLITEDGICEKKLIVIK